jgi:hypothetical protein
MISLNVTKVLPYDVFLCMLWNKILHVKQCQMCGNEFLKLKSYNIEQTHYKNVEI